MREARALDDAKLPEPQKQARSLAEPCPGQPPADPFWIPSFTILGILLDLFACYYGSCGVFLAHSPTFKVSCNKRRSGEHYARSTRDDIPVISKHGYLKLPAFQFCMRFEDGVAVGFCHGRRWRIGDGRGSWCSSIHPSRRVRIPSDEDCTNWTFLHRGDAIPSD